MTEGGLLFFLILGGGVAALLVVILLADMWSVIRGGPSIFEPPFVEQIRQINKSFDLLEREFNRKQEINGVTPKQRREAAAKRLERNLPKKGKSGETTVRDADLKRAINALRK